MGRIGAGAEILPEAEQVPPEGLFEIEIPFPVPEKTLAFQVEGESMWPRYDDKDVVLCWREGTSHAEIIGWEAAVRTAEGKRYLKRILQGSRARHYDLESYNAPVIRNVKLEWASKVQLVVRAGEWKQLGRTVQRRISKKMAGRAT
jgi:phage repressor protein C with HTH and peptisase S24 domain